MSKQKIWSEFNRLECGKTEKIFAGTWSFNKRIEISILGDPGAVSRAGRKGETKVFKYRRKSPWVPTFTGPFPNGQANAGS